MAGPDIVVFPALDPQPHTPSPVLPLPGLFPLPPLASYPHQASLKNSDSLRNRGCYRSRRHRPAVDAPSSPRGVFPRALSVPLVARVPRIGRIHSVSCAMVKDKRRGE